MAVSTISNSPTQTSPAAEGRPASRLLANVGEMTIRVHAPKHEPRDVRIRSPKCTVGSAAGCTLRLRARGVGGLHCWILRGPQGTVVRSLHGSTTLIGAQFDDYPIRIGDRLRIGPVELEILECNQPLAAQQPVFQPAAAPSAEASELQLKLEEAELQNKRLQAESRQAFQSSIVAAERADQLRDALALANDQLEEMYKEKAASEQTIIKKTTELEDCRRQLTALSEVDKKGSPSTAKARWQATAAAKQCELLAAEFASAKSAMNKERESWSIERAELQRQIAQQASELESGRITSVSDTCALTSSNERSKDDAARKELQAKLADVEQQLAAKQQEVDSLQERLDKESAQSGAMTVTLNERSKEEDAARKALQAKVIDLEEQLAAGKREIDSLQQKLDSESTQRCTMTAAFNERSKEVDSARAELHTKVTDLEQQLAARQRENELLQQKLDSESAQCGTMTVAFNERSKEEDTARKELQSKVANLEQQLSARQREMDSLQQRLDSESAEGCAMTMAFNEKLKEDDSTQKALQAKVADLEQQLAGRQREIDSLQQKLDSESAQCGTMTVALNEQSKEEDAARTELQSKVAQLEQQLAARQREIDSLQQRLDSQSGEGCAMTIAFGGQSKGDDSAPKELQSKLAEMEQQLAARQREIDSLRQRLASQSGEGCAMTIAFGGQSKGDDSAPSELQSKLVEFEEQL